MSTDKKVSIIVPIYNVEKFLDVCVNSIVLQTYNNLEIILVDDGSKDFSGRLCDEWKSRDSRITVYHKPNGGLSDARNFGISKSTGDYLFFLDSDDFIRSDFISDLVVLIENSGSDIAIVPMCHTKETTNEPVLFEGEEHKRIHDSRSALIASMYQKEFSCNAPSKLYKKEIFNEISFPVGRVSEDLAIAHRLFDKADRIVVSDKWGYYYRQRERSILHTFNSKRLDALQWLDQIMDEYGKNDPEMAKAVHCRIVNVSAHLLLDIPDRKKYSKEFDVVWNHMRESRFQTLFNVNARKQDRGAALLSYFGHSVMKKAWNSKLAVKRKEY